jgi:hypothetical protein
MPLSGFRVEARYAALFVAYHILTLRQNILHLLLRGVCVALVLKDKGCGGAIIVRCDDKAVPAVIIRLHLADHGHSFLSRFVWHPL